MNAVHEAAIGRWQADQSWRPGAAPIGAWRRIHERAQIQRARCEVGPMRLPRAIARAGSSDWSQPDHLATPAEQEAHVLAAERRAAVLAAVDGLGGRSGEAVRLVFGLSGEAPLTHAEAAEAMGVTRQRCGQLVARGLVQLRTALAEWVAP